MDAVKKELRVRPRSIIIYGMNIRKQSVMVQNESHPAGPGRASDSEASGRPPSTRNKRAER